MKSAQRAGFAMVLALGALTATAADRLVIKGSNTFGEELGPSLIEAYRRGHTNVTIELDREGSASGFLGLLRGEADIGASSRHASEDELRQAQSRGVALRAHAIGYYGVAVIVNSANPLQGLKHEQVCDLFTGAARSWQEVGGPEAPVRLFIRDPSSGTYLGFQELAMERKPYAGSATPLPDYGAIVDAVAADPNAIGYAPMNLTSHTGVRGLRVNGVPSTVVAVNEGAYPYSRTLWLYTVRGRESTEAKSFIRFVQSQAGQQVLSDAGFVRHFESRLWFPSF